MPTRLTIACVCTGLAAAVQSHYAGRATDDLGSGFIPALQVATLFAAVGCAALGLAVIATPRLRRQVGSLVRIRLDPRLKGWEVPATTTGALVALAQAALVPVMGVALYTIGFVAGQAVFGLLADRVGLGGGQMRTIGATRAAAVVMVLVGVALAADARFTVETSAALGYVALALIAGGALTLQQSANGRLTAVTQAPVLIAFLNFVLGLALSAVAIAVVAAVAPGSLSRPPHGDPYVAGLIPVLLVVVAAIAVPVVGVLVVATGFVGGQVLGALLLDLLTGGGVANPASLVLGAGLVLAGAALALGPIGRESRVPPGSRPGPP